MATNYEDFNPNDPYAEDNKFKPAYCLNFATGEVWFGGGKAYIAPDGSGYFANKQFQFDAQGHIISNFIPSTYIYEITKATLDNSSSVVISNIINRTIVFTSKSASGAVIPDNAKKKADINFESIYNSDVPNGTIISKIHIINNSRVLLTIKALRTSVYAHFVFPARQGDSMPNTPMYFSEVKLLSGGVLEAYAIKDTTAVGDIAIQILNKGDFRQVSSTETIPNVGGIAMYSRGDIITRSFDNASIQS